MDLGSIGRVGIMRIDFFAKGVLLIGRHVRVLITAGTFQYILQQFANLLAFKIFLDTGSGLEGI